MPLIAFLHRWSLCALLIAGCGGGGDESPQVTELSAGDLDAQCAEWNERVTGDPEVLEGLCRIRGAGRALLDPQLASMDPVVACEMEAQRCMTTPGTDQFCFGELQPQCTVRVDDVGNCVDVTVNQWRMATSRTCEEQLERLMNMRLAQQVSMPFPDPIGDACHESDACFVPIVSINPNGGASFSDAPPAGAGTGGAGGMSGSAGSAGQAGIGGAAGNSNAGPYMPDEACMAQYPNPNSSCAICVCSPQVRGPSGGCLELYDNCFANPDPMFTMLCSAVVSCTIENDCVGSTCYAPQLCEAEIDAAAMYPSGGTAASCGTGEMDSNACRASSLLAACTQYDAMMVDGPCRQSCR